MSGRRVTTLAVGGAVPEGEVLTAERVARNDATFREANEGIRDAAQAYDVQESIPFICECADPNCRELVQLSLASYEQIRQNSRHFLNVPGHDASAGGWAKVVEHHANYVIVEKVGRAGEITEELDPRAEQ